MNKHRKYKSTFVIWLEFLPFLLLWGLQRIMPLKVAYRFNGLILKIWFMIDRKHHNRTLQHLKHAGMAGNNAAAKQLAAKIYCNLAKLAAEVFKFDQLIANGNIEEILKIEGPKEACDLVTQGKPIIIVTAHCGNWEMAGTGYCLAYKKPLVSVMRPFNNPLIGNFILNSRKSSGHQSFEKKSAIKHLLKALRNDTAVALLVDQHASSSEGVKTTFFGQPARTHVSPAMLHLKTGAPIVVSVTRRLDDGFHFKSFVKGPIRYQSTGDKEKDLQTVTQLYTTTLEELIREVPEQWLWLHRRWLNINRKTKLEVRS
ncbi:MAG: lysophospholipid acyltransferase family protein [Victivallaceae bacterium]|nr:lysophospholipid acyltransferase family protein [Victivallaceae bacterium]